MWLCAVLMCECVCFSQNRLSDFVLTSEIAGSTIQVYRLEFKWTGAAADIMYTMCTDLFSLAKAHFPSKWYPYKIDFILKCQVRNHLEWPKSILTSKLSRLKSDSRMTPVGIGPSNYDTCNVQKPDEAALDVTLSSKKRTSIFDLQSPAKRVKSTSEIFWFEREGNILNSPAKKPVMDRDSD